MKKIIAFLLIVAVGIAGTAIMIQLKPKTPVVEAKEQFWRVRIQTVTPQSLTPMVVLYGRVESPRVATLRTPTLSQGSVIVEETRVLEGEDVRQGQTLIELDNQDSLLNLQQRQADVNDVQAQINLEKENHRNNVTSLAYEKNLFKLTQKAVQRASQLKQRNVGSQATLEEAQRAVEQQKLALNTRKTAIKNHTAKLNRLQAALQRATSLRDMAKLELQRLTITSPYPGRVAKLMVAKGDRVRAGDALISVYDTTALEIRAQIPNRYRNLIVNQLHQSNVLSAETVVGNHTISLKLGRLAGEINKNRGGIDALFQVQADHSWLLYLNQFVTLSLHLPQKPDLVALPFEALYGTDRIYKLQNERMMPIQVNRVGEYRPLNASAKILVHSPELQAGDQVVVTQLPNAMEGLKVKAINEEQ